MLITLSWREILVAIVLAGLIYLMGFLFLRGGRKPSRQDLTLSTQLSRISEELGRLTKRIEQLEAVREGGMEPEVQATQSVYEYAVSCAQDGMSAEEIVGRCGISLSEATLIVTIQNRSK
jgi:hypothetical protein